MWPWREACRQSVSRSQILIRLHGGGAINLKRADYLPIVGAANNEGAAFVKLDIINGRDFVRLKVRVAEHRLHPLQTAHLLQRAHLAGAVAWARRGQAQARQNVEFSGGRIRVGVASRLGALGLTLFMWLDLKKPEFGALAQFCRSKAPAAAWSKRRGPGGPGSRSTHQTCSRLVFLPSWCVGAASFALGSETCLKKRKAYLPKDLFEGRGPQPVLEGS